MAGALLQTTVSELPASRVRIEAQVDPDEFQQAVEHAARRLGANLRVPGFRKGKTPTPLIIQRVGRPAVVEQAVKDGLTRWYGAALDDSAIIAVGQPTLNVGEAPADGQPLTFTIEIGVIPKATLGRYKGLEVGRREPETSDEAIAAELQALRERHARAESVQRPARDGDLLVIDFDGLVDGEPFAGGRGRDQMVQLGSGMLVAGFEGQLEGAVAGEERIVAIDFPDVQSPTDHRAEDVSGSRANFTVLVKDVLARELPAADDAFARDSAGFETLELLREDIAKDLLAADEQRAAEELAETALDAAVAEATLEIPDELVAARAREIWERRVRTLEDEGVAKDVYLQIAGKSEAQVLAELGPQASAELSREAVVAAIAATEDIAIDDTQLRAAAEPVSDGGVTVPPTRASRRQELVRRRVLDLLAGAAVAISIEDALARGKPRPRDDAAVTPELPEPPEPSEDVTVVEPGKMP